MILLILLACSSPDTGSDDGRRPESSATTATETQDDNDQDGESEGEEKTDDEGDGDPSDDDTGGDNGTDDPEDKQEECPPDAHFCVDAFPYTNSADTSTSSTSDFDAYSCAASTDESGPEHIYWVNIEDAGYLSVSLDGVGDDVDVDVHILGSLDPDDCHDRGHWYAGSLLPAGQYWVLVDSWASGGTVYDGEYELTIGLTTPDAHQADGLDTAVAEQALHAFDIAWLDGETETFIYTIIDFSMHSSLERQFTIDLATGELWWTLHVTHGENSADNSDWGTATSFSNIEDSHQSSLGMMRTAETYSGTYGYSLRLDGLETHYNDNVRDRYIVVHGWNYARPEVADQYGYLGLSWGCPAIDDRISDDFIDDVAGGSLYFSYFPDGDWSVDSSYLP